jgi:DNA-binding MarR family transcriptional regulator/GNAT superfamily N-acetyltransferase
MTLCEHLRMPAAASPTPTVEPEQVAALRRFSRFYTRQLGVLNEHLLDSRFTLPESRVLWELAHHDGISAAALARELDIDPGYLSRLLAGLKARSLLRAQPLPGDARQSLLRLSAAGRKAFAPLDRRSEALTTQMLSALGSTQRRQLVDAADTLTRLLGEPPSDGEVGDTTPFTLRPPRCGDIGWVIARHGALYGAEYGWGLRFEALVAELCARFVERFDPAKEACWIAERDGQPLGCVFLVQARDDADAEPLPGVAQLRMLIVEPSARGMGVGDRLVAECTRFAQAAGYTRIRLWTNSVLSAARRLYVRHGYRLVDSAPHAEFGIELVGEIWELDL